MGWFGNIEQPQGGIYVVHIIYMFDFILKFLENTGCAFSMSISTKFKSFGTELRKRKGCKFLVSGILGQNTYPKGIKNPISAEHKWFQGWDLGIHTCFKSWEWVTSIEGLLFGGDLACWFHTK